MLSPDLFNYYINDLVDRMREEGFESFLYADDLAAIVQGVAQARRLVKVVENWGKQNYLALNKAKCGIMFLTTSRTTRTQKELCRGEIEEIPIVDRYKYLGVTL